MLDVNLSNLIDELSVQTGRNGLRQALMAFTEASGFDDFAFVCHGGAEMTGVSSYSAEWQARYVEDNLVVVDPIIRLARQNMRPFTWSRKDPAFQRGLYRTFFKNAQENGISSGLTIPIPGSYGRFATLTLASSEAEAAGEIEIANPVRATTAAALIYASLSQNARFSPGVSEPVLTIRQATCLSWASYGKTMLEIAVLMGISHNTVRFHLDDAKAKLGASNTAHAVRLAAQRGMI